MFVENEGTEALATTSCGEEAFAVPSLGPFQIGAAHARTSGTLAGSDRPRFPALVPSPDGSI